jgi:ABC-type Fe3+/spermidine/putrescine transport system ATPase subunit
VTHEQEEAFELGDRVAVLSRGRLEQVGSPEDLYEEPATRFVATFIGRSTVLPGIWTSAGTVTLAGRAAWPARGVVPDGRFEDGEPVDLVVRPESAALAAEGTASALPGKVAERRYAGRFAFYIVHLEGIGEIEVLAAPDAARPGEAVAVAPAAGAPLPRAYPREGAGG